MLIPRVNRCVADAPCYGVSGVPWRESVGPVSHARPCLCSLAAVLLVAPSAWAGATPETTLVSSGGQGAAEPAISADGRFVAFTQQAFVPRGLYQVYRGDLLTGEKALVSRASGESGEPAEGTYPSLSADGRFVAFASPAADLSEQDLDGEYPRGVFVRDLQTQETTLLPRPPAARNAVIEINKAVISANGRFVTYEAEFLDEEREPALQLVYVHDTVERSTKLASRASGRQGRRANGDASLGSISADGRLVVFSSDASNLAANDRDSRNRDVFVRNTQTDRTTLVSRPTGRRSMDDDSSEPVISADGRFLAYTRQLFFDNVERSSPSQILVRDLLTGKTALVSRASGRFGPTGGDDSSAPAVSADGRFVAFQSYAANLSADDSDVVSDVLVHDRVSRNTTLISRASGHTGAKGRAASIEASISGDGQSVAFASFAPNLVRGDTDAATSDVFVRRIACVASRCRNGRR